MTPTNEHQVQQHQDVCSTATTGDLAPLSGWWRPDGDPAPFRYLEQGETMPLLHGRKTLWTLVFELAPSARAHGAKYPSLVTGTRAHQFELLESVNDAVGSA